MKTTIIVIICILCLYACFLWNNRIVLPKNHPACKAKEGEVNLNLARHAAEHGPWYGGIYTCRRK